MCESLAVKSIGLSTVKLIYIAYLNTTAVDQNDAQQTINQVQSVKE